MIAGYVLDVVAEICLEHKAGQFKGHVKVELKAATIYGLFGVEVEELNGGIVAKMRNALNEESK